jgi:arsenate reductase (glutaredoxin)
MLYHPRMSATIYHNPKCVTSRKVLGFLRDAGIEPKIIEYLKDPPSKTKLTELARAAGLKPRALLRKKEKLYKELDLDAADVTDAKALEAMLAHPVLIERPIVEIGALAMLCRPPERVYEILPAAKSAKNSKQK